MDDATVAAHIERLVAEEHALLDEEQRDRSSEDALATDRRRLEAVQVELDRCWDLLRRRRALRSSGGDPDDAVLRDADVVEGYLQ